MKKILKTVTIITAFTISSSLLYARENKETKIHTPKWVSDKGYWVIESNIKTPDTSIIHFYTNDNTKVYSEKVEGITLNLKKRKTLMGLKKALEASLLAYQQPQLTDNASLVRNILRQ
jgi:hypothetical protein